MSSKSLKPSMFEKVSTALFDKKILSNLTNLKLKFIQLHGSENEEYIKILKKNDLRIIKSISIRNKDDLRKIDKYESVDYFKSKNKSIISKVDRDSFKILDIKAPSAFPFVL